MNIRPTILPARVSVPPFWRGVCCGFAVFGILGTAAMVLP